MSATLDLQAPRPAARRRADRFRARPQLRCRDALRGAAPGSSSRAANGAGGAHRPARSRRRHPVFPARRRGDSPRAARPAGRRASIAGVRVLPLYGELEGAAQDAALAPRLRGTAQGRARHQHCGNQPHHRRHSRGRRLRIAPLCGIRSRHGHESPGDREGVAGRGGSTSRTRRPLERGRLLPAVVGRHACVARARKRRRKSCTRILRRWPWSSPAGAR